jgi:hypothetical protein
MRHRYHGSHPFMSKARHEAVDRERRFLANRRSTPHLFGHTDDVAVYLRKRARDRMHTIVREQQYLKQYPRISKYMPRRLLRNPKYKKYPRVRLPQQVYRKKPFGK